MKDQVMFSFTKGKRSALFGILTGVGVVFIATLYFASTQFATPTKEEIEAMDILPGYMFEYDGNTNVINQYGRIKQFQAQHRLMPYLVMVADSFKVYNWPKAWPIRIRETENNVIVTWPSEGEFLEERRFLWSAPYLQEVVIDKKTMKIVSALRGP